MPNAWFDDLISDFDGGKAAPPQSVQTAPQPLAASRHLPEDCFTPQTSELYRVRCEKCSGTGVWKGGYARFPRQCFGCLGKGFVERKTNPQVLQAAATRRVEKKIASAAENIEAFKAAQPEVWAWVVQAAPTFEFAASLGEAVQKFGDLTERQLAAATKCAEGHNSRKAAAQARVVNAPVVASVDKLMAAFETASKSGLKRPVLRFQEFKASLAPATGRNAGSAYVKSNDDVYLGKITQGRFIATGECSEAQRKAVVEAMSNPLEQAISYGRRTGSCSCCGRELSDPVSVANGVGPICQSRWGL